MYTSGHFRGYWFWQALLEGVIPRTCIKCGKSILIESHVVGSCTVCTSNWSVFEPGIITETLFRERFYTKWSAVGFRLNGTGTKAIVYKCKYGGEPGTVRELGRWMGMRFPAPEIECLLVPIPIHWKRRTIRGYNQAELIASGLSDIWGMKVDAFALRRRKHGSSLTGASREGRAKKMIDVYELGEQPEGEQRPIILVDDVLTTGATLRACREVLEISGRMVLGAAVLALA